jgi:hypothetical protein
LAKTYEVFYKLELAKIEVGEIAELIIADEFIERI